MYSFQTKTNSQAGQDHFALSVARLMGLKFPTYIEIGAQWPDTDSNTLELERRGWSGISIERDVRFQIPWIDSGRKNIIYWQDALKFGYLAAW